MTETEQLKKDKDDLLNSLYEITKAESPREMYDLAVESLHKYKYRKNKVKK